MLPIIIYHESESFLPHSNISFKLCNTSCKSTTQTYFIHFRPIRWIRSSNNFENPHRCQESAPLDTSH